MSDAFEKRRHVQQRFIGRVSSYMNDPGYQNWLNLRGSNYKMEVRLNGVVQHDVNIVDVEGGWLERLAMHNGAPLMRNGSFVLQELKGEVEIRLVKE